MKIKTILRSLMLFLVSVQVNAALPEKVLVDLSEVTVRAELIPLPMLSAFWIFGAALLAFVGFSRRTNIN